MTLRIAPACLLLFALAAPAQTIRMEGGAFRVDNWQAAREPAAGWGSILHVYAGEGDVPPLLGSYAVEGGVLVFRPKYPLGAGVHLRAEFSPGGAAPVTASFDVPRAVLASTTRVSQVYPTTNLLPENALKLYVCFSAPMSEGEAWQHVHLLDSSGKIIKLAFLEIDQELWDRDHTRLTILFDPGRIKRGLASMAEAGKILEAGKSYTLSIERDWHDAAGAPLAEAYRKEFRVGPARRDPIDPHEWRVHPPRAGSFQPLEVAFPQPLDYALLMRLFRVSGPSGYVEGKVSVTDEESVWRFTPREPWQPGKFLIEVQKALEDLAGNRIGRAFDVDTFAPVTKEIVGEVVALPFRPRVE